MQQHTLANQLLPPGYVYTPSTVRPGFASRTAKVMGSIQVVIGTMCVMFQIMGIVLHSGLANTGEGIWAGIMVRKSSLFTN